MAESDSGSTADAGAHRSRQALMRPYSYHVVDVFTQTPLEGNALAVFPDGRGLDATTMQRVARETNLSETTFVFPPHSSGAVATVRIFTPAIEMSFAGHPTLGTAYVLSALGRIAPGTRRFSFDEGVGVVPLRVDDGADPMFWLTTPAIERGAAFDARTCAHAVGLEPHDLIEDVPCRLYSAGNPCIYIAVKDPSTVDRAEPDTALLRRAFRESGARACAFVFAPVPAGAYARMFAPHVDVYEDPATGSATGPLALFMMDHGLAPSAAGTRFVSEQGVKMGRRSLLHVIVNGERGAEGIEVGGYVVPIAEGTMTLPVLHDMKAS